MMDPYLENTIRFDINNLKGLKDSIWFTEK